MRDKLERIVGWLLGVMHLAAFLVVFTIGHRLQHEIFISSYRDRWEPIHEAAVRVAIWSAGANTIWWLYATFRRRPFSVLIVVFWLIWLGLLLIGLVGAAGAMLGKASFDEVPLPAAAVILSESHAARV
jgi:hypothetical protein